MSLGLMTTAPPICWANDRWTLQPRPFQCKARDCAPPAVNAQASSAEVAPAATTTSLALPGKGTCVQCAPLRRQAVGTEPWLKAQPPFLPMAVTAVNPPNGPSCTCLTMCHAGTAAWAVQAVPDTAPAAASGAGMTAA